MIFKPDQSGIIKKRLIFLEPIARFYRFSNTLKIVKGIEVYDGFHRHAVGYKHGVHVPALINLHVEGQFINSIAIIFHRWSNMNRIKNLSLGKRNEKKNSNG